MKQLIKIFFLSVSVLVLVLVYKTSSVLAQVRDTDIVLNITPENPGPNQDVNATLNSYAINLDKTNISWSLNNQERMTGIGKKSFFFKTGNSGLSIILSITIETIDGQSISKTMTITGASVDLLWEAYDAYTPPFYKGKTLVLSQGQFKVVAIPNLINQNEKVIPSNLSYVWTQDGTKKLDSSGWGKNFFVFQNSYLDKENVVEVIASNISGSSNASGKIILRTTNPKILFYENDPSLGVKWENALNNGFIINKNGTIIVAEPYFFSPKNIASSELSFDWFLGGQKTETPDPKNILSIKPDTGQSGVSTIKTVINNINTLFQNTEREINVAF